jgi:hypothetical protein
MRESLTRRAVLAGTTAGAALLAVASRAAAQAVRIDDPPPGKASVVFFRKGAYFGGPIGYIVREGTRELGLLASGTYFIADVDPGLHTFTVHAERHSDMQLVVEAGEIYYVHFELDLGVVLYQPTLEPTDQRLFDEQSPRLRPSEPLPPAPATTMPTAKP